MFRGEKMRFFIVSPAIFLLFFMLHGAAYALPVLSNVSSSPAMAWLGQDVIISAECVETENMSISRVYAEVSGPSIILPAIDLVSGGDNTYSVSLSDSARYSRTGAFNAQVYCVSGNGTTDSKSITFTVSNFSTGISSATPSPAYIGDKVEIIFFAKKDGISLSSGVGFNVSLNGGYVSLVQLPAYDLQKGWIMQFYSPASSGKYDLNIRAFYGGAVSDASTALEIKDVYTFTLSSMDKSEVLSGDNVTVVLSASNRGGPIIIEKSHISARVGSYDAQVMDVYPEGGNYKAKIGLPSLSAGKYDLKISFSYGNFTAERTSQLAYVIPVSGRILDPAGNAVGAAIYFTNGAIERVAKTDVQGRYSQNLPPGSYDIKLVHDRATLVMYNLAISGFDNPLRFYYVPDAAVAGIRNAGIFVFESALSPGTSKLMLNYDEKKISKEQDLGVFRCTNWNSAKKECSNSWEKIFATIDVLRNIAEVSRENPSGAYLVGTVDELFLDFSFDKKSYFSGEPMRLTGLSQNAERIPVGNVEIISRVVGQAASKTAASSSDGVFSVEVPAPAIEGNYTISVIARKDPYVSYNVTRNVEVVRTREISILIPDTVRVKPGESTTVEVSVVNTGQSPLQDAALSLSGVPPEYFSIFPAKLSVEAGAEEKIFITFSIPKSAPRTTYGADILLPFGSKTFKRTFALTIMFPEEKTASAPSAENMSSGSGQSVFPTGFATAAITYDVMYLVLFSAISFTTALLLRRRRLLAITPGADAESFKRRTYLLEIRKAVEKGFGASIRCAARKRGKLKLSSRRRK